MAEDQLQAAREHLSRVHGIPDELAIEIAVATGPQPCRLCEAWLRRQLEGLGSERLEGSGGRDPDDRRPHLGRHRIPVLC